MNITLMPNRDHGLVGKTNYAVAGDMPSKFLFV